MFESPSLKLGETLGAWIDTNSDTIYVFPKPFFHNHFLDTNLHLIGEMPQLTSNQDAVLSKDWVRISHTRITELCVEGLINGITKGWKHIVPALRTPGLVRVYIDVIVFKDMRGTMRSTPGQSYAFDVTDYEDRKRLDGFIRKD